jgi:hypothetical protein
VLLSYSITVSWAPFHQHPGEKLVLDLVGIIRECNSCVRKAVVVVERALTGKNFPAAPGSGCTSIHCGLKKQQSSPSPGRVAIPNQRDL